jgi:hypothetical protein
MAPTGRLARNLDQHRDRVAECNGGGTMCLGEQWRPSASTRQPAAVAGAAGAVLTATLAA